MNHLGAKLVVAVGALLLSLGLVFPSGMVAGEEIVFPDAALEAVVRRATETPSGPITAESLARLEKITIYDTEVRDLTGLERCVNLVNLNCQSNKVENIACLARMPQLKQAWLPGNAIRDLSALAGLPNLTELGIGDNPLEDVSVLATLPALRRLTLGNMTLREPAQLAALRDLESLYVSSMKLDNLDFVRGMTGLGQIDASGNEITSLEPLRDLTQITALELDSNRILDISPLAGLPNLNRLNLAHNQIERVDEFPTPQRAAQIDLSANRISDIRPLVKASVYSGELVLELGQNRLNADAFCRDIPELEVRGNHVYFKHAFPVEKAQYFPASGALCATLARPDAELILAAVNRGAPAQEINERFGMALPPGRGAAAVASAPTGRSKGRVGGQGVTVAAKPAPTAEAAPVASDPRFPDAKLEGAIRKALKIPEGPLTSEALGGLTELFASRAGIANLSGIELLPNLKKADLQNNKISDVRPLATLAKLEHLYLTYNNVSDIGPLAGLQRLTWLSLGNNKLADIGPVASLLALEHLSLAGNREIENIEVIAGLPQIKGLYINRMALTALDFVSGLATLRSLSADSNKFTSLEPLRGLKKLSDIKLDENQITDVSPLSGLSEISYLNLSQNRIASIEGIPSLKSNARVELFENQITDIRPLVLACGYTGEIMIDLGKNRLGVEAFCRDIPEMEARGNTVVYKYESPEETSVLFPSISVVCSAAERPDVELVLAAVNRGANAAELYELFALGEAPTPADAVAVADNESAPAAAVSAVSAAPPAPPQSPAAPEVTEAPDAATPPEPAPGGEGTSAELAVRLADTELNVSVGATGLDLQSLLGGIALLGVGVMLVIVLRLPRHR